MVASPGVGWWLLRWGGRGAARGKQSTATSIKGDAITVHFMFRSAPFSFDVFFAGMYVYVCFCFCFSSVHLLIGAVFLSYVSHVFCVFFRCLQGHGKGGDGGHVALANSPIRGLAMNSKITKSRIVWSSERPLSSCKQQLCLFACSTSLPAPSRAVSTWCLHKRDQPNNASCCCCCQSKLRTFSAEKKSMNHNAEFSL